MWSGCPCVMIIASSSHWRELDAMIITHGHPDHISDVIPLMYAMGFDDDPPDEPLPVYAPPDVEKRLRAAIGGGKSKELFDKVFVWRPIDDFIIGGITGSSFATDHPIDSCGIRLVADGKTFVYTADTAFFPELADGCRDADLLIAEATYVGAVEADPGVHMWARETGKLAADAKVKRLVLTHIWATFSLEQAVDEAREAYDGPVEAAVEGNVYAI